MASRRKCKQKPKAATKRKLRAAESSRAAALAEQFNLPIQDVYDMLLMLELYPIFPHCFCPRDEMIVIGPREAEFLCQLDKFDVTLEIKVTRKPKPPRPRKNKGPKKPRGPKLRFSAQSTADFLERIRSGTDPRYAAEARKIEERWRRMEQAAVFFANQNGQKNNS